MPDLLLLLALLPLVLLTPLLLYLLHQHHLTATHRATRRLRHLKLLSSRDPILDFGISRRAAATLSALPARALAAAVRRRALCAETLARAACLRARFAGDAFRAVADERFLDALLAANALDARKRRRGTLCGIPVSVADAIEVEGMDTAPRLRAPAGKDAPVVRRMKEEGAVVVCKSNQVAPPASPYAGGGGVYGGVSNPWRKGVASGGSCGGAAVLAAVRAGWIHVGTDAGGMMRAAAAACGVCDFAPSPGIVEGEVGVLGRVVDDVVLAMEAIGGARLGRVAEGGGGGTGITVGVVRSDHFFGTPHPAMVRGLDMSARLLAEKGYRVVEFALPFDEQGNDIVPLVAALLTRDEWDVVNDEGEEEEEEEEEEAVGPSDDQDLAMGTSAGSVITNSSEGEQEEEEEEGGEEGGKKDAHAVGTYSVASGDVAVPLWPEGERLGRRGGQGGEEGEDLEGPPRPRRSSTLGAFMQPISFLGALHPRLRLGLAWLTGKVLGQRRTATLLKGVNQGLGGKCTDELQAKRAELSAKLADAMAAAGVDAAIMPPAAIPAGAARPRYRHSLLPAFVYSALATVLGFPSGGCPVTRVHTADAVWPNPPADAYDHRARRATKDSQGCPVGCSVFAPPGEDALCLRVLRDLSDAAAFECNPPALDDFLTSWPGPQPGAARPDEQTPLLSSESQDWSQELLSKLLYTARKALGANTSSWKDDVAAASSSMYV